MCTGFESAVIGSLVAGTAVQAQSASKERKAAKSRAAAEKKAAEEKIIADKQARVTERESIATGQTASIDASNALKALGNTSTGASETLGDQNLGGKVLIGG